MITDLPSAQDFYDSGKDLLGLAWDSISQLLLNLDEAEYFGIDTEEVSDAYWEAARLRLATALSTTQQGVEFLIKGRITEVSPFLLIVDNPSKWPSPYTGSPLKFSQFRTLDAQDLPRVHDTVSLKPLSAAFVEKFVWLRESRNTIMHSVDKELTVPVVGVLKSILFVHKNLFPDEHWPSVRLSQLEKAPDIELGSIDYVRNRVCWEMSVVLDLLNPSEVKLYFNIDKKQRRYTCPVCYYEASRDAGFEYQLAVLRPNSSKSTKLYCPICDLLHKVVRRKCDSNCPGNVLDGDGTCLTCAS